MLMQIKLWIIKLTKNAMIKLLYYIFNSITDIFYYIYVQD